MNRDTGGRGYVALGDKPADHPRDYGTTGAQSANASNMPTEPALEGILRRIAEIRENVFGLRAVADRACGAPPPAEDRISCSSNGLLDAIESELDDLRGETYDVLTRLRRLGSI